MVGFSLLVSFNQADHAMSNSVGKWLCVGSWHGVVWLARLELPFPGTPRTAEKEAYYRPPPWR
jgi:hypothetical protein